MGPKTTLKTNKSSKNQINNSKSTRLVNIIETEETSSKTPTSSNIVLNPPTSNLKRTRNIISSINISSLSNQQSSKSTVENEDENIQIISLNENSNSSLSSTLSLINNQLNFQNNQKQRKAKIDESKRLEFENILKRLNKEALENNFEAKIFTIENRIIKKSPIFHFFHSNTDFGQNKPEMLEFVCIICFTILNQNFNIASTNLMHHLRIHNRPNDDKAKLWLSRYDAKNLSDSKHSIDFNTMNLIKYILSSMVMVK